MPTTIEIPDGVGVASLALVGNATRVLLRSDGRFVCVTCNKTPTITEAQDEAQAAVPGRNVRNASDSCHHIDSILTLGIVRLQTGPDNRLFPEFVWRRNGAGTVQARWPESGDPDNAIGILAEAIKATMAGARNNYAFTDQYCRAIAESAIIGLGRKGYVVHPEWMGRARRVPLKPGQSGRGARLIDLDDDGSDAS
jgi:hypothetical protein